VARGEGLERIDAAIARLEQALEVLARVHQPARTDDARRVDQDRIGHAPDLEGDPDLRRDDVPAVLEIALLHEPLVCIGGAVAREHHPEVGILAARDRAHDRKQARADRAGRRQKEEQRAALVRRRAPDGELSTAAVVQPEDRRSLADPRALPSDQRSSRGHALVQKADLTEQRHHHGREHDDRDPEQQVRDDECLDHRVGSPCHCRSRTAFASARSAAA
jgi:hypothetical protein